METLEQFVKSLKVAYVVKIKLFFIDWFYYNLVILIKSNAKSHIKV